MVGAKLITSIMASEDIILENISVGLLQARFVLSTISSSDPSLELQQLCCKLLWKKKTRNCHTIFLRIDRVYLVRKTFYMRM